MERILAICSEEDRKDATPKLKQLREVYDAYFAPIDESQLTLSEEDTPLHIKRAERLLLSLEDDHDD